MAYDAVRLFLGEAGMLLDESCLLTLSDEFMAEMERGLSGADSSLLMLPSYIYESDIAPKNKRVLAIDAGGTNLRIASVLFRKNDKPLIENFSSRPMPGIDKAITLKEFFELLAEYLSPLIKDIYEIGFCFSFPAKIRENGDGEILYFDKEIKITGASGASIRDGLNAALTARGFGEKLITVINDSTACAVCGRAEFMDKFGAYIGYVMGTGTNISYLEKTESIKKISPQNSGRQKTEEITSAKNCERMAVNIESGGYCGFKQGSFDIELDGKSADPGHHKFEKMASGRYFGELTLLTLKGFAKTGGLSENRAEEILSLFSLSSAEAYRFYGADGNDLKSIKKIIAALYDRAAAYCAAALFAAMRMDGRGARYEENGDYPDINKSQNIIGAAKPIGIIADGTMFYGCEPFREKLKKYLDGLCGPAGIAYEFLKSENSGIIGAASAAADYSK